MSFWKGFLSIFIDESPRTDLQISVKKMWEEYKKILEDSYFDEIFVATEYQKISHLLERYKFHSDRQLSTIFADMFAQMIQKTEMNFQDFVLIPTPMHWTRYWIRGFDTIGLIVKKISKITKIPHISLLKTKFSRRQLTLSREERLKNRKKNFFYQKNSKNSWKSDSFWWCTHNRLHYQWMCKSLEKRLSKGNYRLCTCN